MTPDEIEKDRAAGAWCIVTRFFTRVWCDITHGGGRIERDSHGRINWRCARCGRWSDHPVPLKDERATDYGLSIEAGEIIKDGGERARAALQENTDE